MSFVFQNMQLILTIILVFLCKSVHYKITIDIMDSLSKIISKRECAKRDHVDNLIL